MIGQIIFLILLVILAFALYSNIKNGLVLYLIFSMISPHLKVMGLQLSFEILAFFLIVGIVLLKMKFNFSEFSKSIYIKRLLFYLIVYVLSSFITVLRFDSAIPWIAFMGIFRSIFIIYMLQIIFKDKQDNILDRIISPILFINLIVSIIQLTIPESVHIFYDFYYKASMTPLINVVELGFFNRAYGTFGTPVLLGAFAVLSFAVYLCFMLENKKCPKIYLKLIVSILVGLLSMSKTAILGIPIIIATCFILILFGIIKIRNRKKVIKATLLIALITIVAILILISRGTSISWYLNFLLKPFEAFTTRYSPTAGLLSSTYSTIAHNWLIGVGGISINNAFLGDSMYIMIMYSTGLIGMIVFFATLIDAGIKNLKLKNCAPFLCVIAIMIIGLGAQLQFDMVSLPFFAYIFYSTEIFKGKLNKPVVEKDSKTNNKTVIKRIVKVFQNPKLGLLYLLNSKISKILPDRLYLKLKYRTIMGKKLDLKKPITFNEKLQWLKLHNRKKIYTNMVDKYKVRRYISKKLGSEYLIPLLGVYKSFDDIDFDKLPNQFVLKPNHTSGDIYICRDKLKINHDELREKVTKWLKRKYYWLHREWPYKNIEPRIICEKYMIDESGAELKDYKIMCFNGKARCSFVCSNRGLKNGLNVDFYDMNWEPMPFERHYHKSDKTIPKPKTFNKMIEFAEILSKNISFVRVDFYDINGKLYFGELTFYPGSGFEEFTPEKYDNLLGNWIEL